MPQDQRPEVYDAVHKALADVRAHMVTVLASHPQWASMQFAAQQAATGADADTVYRQKLEAIFAGVPAYHALVRLDEALALLPALSTTVLAERRSATFETTPLDVLVEAASDETGSLSSRIPTLQLVRNRSEPDARMPKSSPALQAYAAPAGTAVSTYTSISLQDIIEQIRRGAASQSPKSLRLLFPHGIGSLPEEAYAAPPKAAAAAVPAPGFVHAEVAARHGKDVLVGAKKQTSAGAQDQLPLSGALFVDALAPTIQMAPAPAALPLHEVASHRLDELEAEIQILTNKPVLQIAPPQPFVAREVAVTALPVEDEDQIGRSINPDLDVDEAEIEIVKSPPKASITLQPLPDLPLRPHWTPAADSKADKIRSGGGSIPDTNYSFGMAEEASVVIVRRSPDEPVAAQLAFYAESQPKTAGSSVRRFLKALNGH